MVGGGGGGSVGVDSLDTGTDLLILVTLVGKSGM
jgi:hypothetical protein